VAADGLPGRIAVRLCNNMPGAAGALAGCDGRRASVPRATDPRPAAAPPSPTCRSAQMPCSSTCFVCEKEPVLRVRGGKAWFYGATA
jgi:hypothetical protein